MNGTYCQVARNTPQVELYCERGVIQLGGWARPRSRSRSGAESQPTACRAGWYQPDRLQPTMKHTVADLAHFADCVADGLQPVHSAAHAAHVIEVIERVYAAAQDRAGAERRVDDGDLGYRRQAEVPADDPSQLGRAERLGEVVVGAEVEAAG